MKLLKIGVLGLLLGFGTASNALAQAAPAAERAERLDELILGTKENDYEVSKKDYELTAGKYYRLKITAAGFKEYMFRAPELFRTSWIYQVSIEDKEVHTNWIHGVEFDDQGTVEIFFAPQRGGEFEWYIEQFRGNGMSGKFVVKYAQ